MIRIVAISPIFRCEVPGGINRKSPVSSMVLEKNGDIVQTGAGGAVLGHPAVAVAWLANAIGQFGVSLGAGEIVMP